MSGECGEGGYADRIEQSYQGTKTNLESSSNLAQQNLKIEHALAPAELTNGLKAEKRKAVRAARKEERAAIAAEARDRSDPSTRPSMPRRRGRGRTSPGTSSRHGTGRRRPRQLQEHDAEQASRRQAAEAQRQLARADERARRG